MEFNTAIILNMKGKIEFIKLSKNQIRVFVLFMTISAKWKLEGVPLRVAHRRLVKIW